MSPRRRALGALLSFAHRPLRRPTRCRRSARDFCAHQQLAKGAMVMAVKNSPRGRVTLLKPLGSAIEMNLVGAILTRRRGYRGWTGAGNNDYDPLDPAP